MGVSIVVSGVIISVAIMSVLFAMPNVVDSIIDVSQSSIQASDLVEQISNTRIDISNITATANSQDVTFLLSNNATEKLWNYEDFTVIVTYNADIGGTPTLVTEMFSYDSTVSFDGSGGSSETVILRPDALTSGGWNTQTGCGGGATQDCINENVRDDADYITSARLGSNEFETVQYSFGDATIPLQINDITLRYTYREEAQGTSSPDLRVTLLEGASTRAGPWTELGPLGNPAFSQSNRLLSPAEITSIVDPNSLSIELHAVCNGCPPQGGQKDRVSVSWVELVIDGGEPSSLGIPPFTSGWKIVDVISDHTDPRIINSDEYAWIYLVLSNPLSSTGGEVIVSVSTDNGVTATVADTV